MGGDAVLAHSVAGISSCWAISSNFGRFTPVTIEFRVYFLVLPGLYQNIFVRALMVLTLLWLKKLSWIYILV